MNLTDKSKKLLEYSVILKAKDKKTWLDMLPKMSEKQVQTLYDVLVDEVKAWKKEGISIIPDTTVEGDLVPQPDHGASFSSLKEMLSGNKNMPQPKLDQSAAFKKELEREIHTPEITAHKEVPKPQPLKAVVPPVPSPLPEKEEAELELGELKPENNLPNSAWMLNNKVVVPKSQQSRIDPRPMAVPKVRNRKAQHGLNDLHDLKTIDDLKKIEPAHLRQRSLPEQVSYIKQSIAKLSASNDTLPINILPVFEQSPLFKTYLKAGALLIDKNMEGGKANFDEVMGDLAAAGMDTLSQQEFEAVADLKKDLEVMAGL